MLDIQQIECEVTAEDAETCRQSMAARKRAQENGTIDEHPIGYCSSCIVSTVLRRVLEAGHVSGSSAEMLVADEYPIKKSGATIYDLDDRGREVMSKFDSTPLAVQSRDLSKFVGKKFTITRSKFKAPPTEDPFEVTSSQQTTNTKGDKK